MNGMALRTWSEVALAFVIDSFYQLHRHLALFRRIPQDTDASVRLRDAMDRMDAELSRNERAAVAMLLLQRLNAGPMR